MDYSATLIILFLIYSFREPLGLVSKSAKDTGCSLSSLGCLGVAFAILLALASL